MRQPEQLNAHEVVPDLWLGDLAFATGSGLGAVGATHVLTVARGRADLPPAGALREAGVQHKVVPIGGDQHMLAQLQVPALC